MIEKTYRVWQAMKTRCYNSNSKDYKNYGERGITVCKEWINSYKIFIADMRPRPTGKTLDRIDNNGPYCKENCRWATRKEQAQNLRKNVYVEYQGNRLLLEEAAKILNCKVGALYWRVEHGWSSNRIFSINPKVGNNQHRTD